MADERVLVVDDSTEVQEALRNLVLEPGGYRILTADDGMEGLRLALEESPDLIILDARMPRMDGIEVLKELKNRNVQIPVIFTTFHGSEDLAVKVFRLGVQDYVIKPFEPREMQSTVKRVLEDAHLRAERDRSFRQIQAANERLQQQLEEMQTLFRIGRSIGTLLDAETVFDQVVEAAVSVSKAEEGFLLLKEEGGEELVLQAAKNLDERMAGGLRVQIEDSLAGEVMRTGKPMLMSRGRPKVSTGYLVNALAYVPLKTPERGIMGVLGVVNRRSERAFGEHEVRLLSALAGYAAVALENAHLYDRAESERLKLRTVLQETGEPVIVLDSRQHILLCNEAAYSALDLPGDVVGRLAKAAIQHPALRALLRSALTRRRTARTQVEVEDGRIFSAELTRIEGVGYVLMMQDITQLKELDRIKSEFVFTVSHDLRTPLTTIQGYVSLLDRVGPLNEQQQEFVERIRTSIVDITSLISELLDLGRIEAGYDLEMEPLHLEAVIDHVVEEFRPVAAEKNQELRWTPRTLPLVHGDRQRLRQVVENLLNNALKYTQEGGRIAVEATEGKDHVVVHVADNGIGIPAADQPYIFERFYRVESTQTQDFKGTGLGLTIVRSVVEKHGGRVWVESRPGVGSVFTFVLPTLE